MLLFVLMFVYVVCSFVLLCCLFFCFFVFLFQLKRLRMVLRCAVTDSERRNSLSKETSKPFVLFTRTTGSASTVRRPDFHGG